MQVALRHVARRIALVAALLSAVMLAVLAAYRMGPLSRQAGPLPVTGAVPRADLALQVFNPPRAVPPVRFSAADGRALSLDKFRGRVVLLDVWATWCGPCREEMPSLDRLDGKLGGADFAVLPVSLDGKGTAAVEPFYRALGIERLGIYLDPLGRGTRALAIPGVPTTLLIDRGGRMVAKKAGGAQWDSASMIALIRRYLPPDAAPTDGR
jgi:thiol-disulfide isomerase/thioredoxin